MACMNTLLLMLHIMHHLFEAYYYKNYDSTEIFKGTNITNTFQKLEKKLTSRNYRSSTIYSRVDKDKKQ